MKYLFLSGLGSWSLAACQSNENKSGSEGISIQFKWNTVDGPSWRGNFLFLKLSAIPCQAGPPTKNNLYNFNYQEYSIEKIDLDELKFVSKINPLTRKDPMGWEPTSESLETHRGRPFFILQVMGRNNIINDQGKKLEQFEFAKMGSDEEKLMNAIISWPH